MIIQFFIFVFGLVFLWFGAEILVKNSSRLAKSMGISPVIIGLSVVSMGTSAPELVVSVVAVIEGNPGISIGNIVGSNIANMGLILGIGAMICPMEVKLNWVKREVPFMIGVTIVFIFLAYAGLELSFFDGIVLLLLMAVFMYYLVRYSAKEMAEFKEIQETSLQSEVLEKHSPPKKRMYFLLLALAGAAVLVFGSEITVSSGKKIAEYFGVSDLVIGLTLVALGTSLPEMATTIIAAIRKETDLIIGNVVGSNIFNLLLIGGVVPLIKPIPIDSNLFAVQFPILIMLSILILPMMRIKMNLQRYEGMLLFIIYFLFVYFTL